MLKTASDFLKFHEFVRHCCLPEMLKTLVIEWFNKNERNNLRIMRRSRKKRHNVFPHKSTHGRNTTVEVGEDDGEQSITAIEESLQRNNRWDLEHRWS